MPVGVELERVEEAAGLSLPKSHGQSGNDQGGEDEARDDHSAAMFAKKGAGELLGSLVRAGGPAGPAAFVAHVVSVV